MTADSKGVGPARGGIVNDALGGLDLVHMLVTDDAIRPEDRRAIEAIGVEVLIA